jgi:hypothetical protein
MKKAFSKGTIPWTKAREAVKAATPETDKKWVKKCLEMTNRQIEKEVKQTLPPVKKKSLVLVLEGDMLDVWEQARAPCERLAGKALTDIEVFDLMCAEVLCTYATTPPFDPEEEDDGGAVRSIAERDGWKCNVARMQFEDGSSRGSHQASKQGWSRQGLEQDDSLRYLSPCKNDGYSQSQRSRPGRSHVGRTVWGD